MFFSTLSMLFVLLQTNQDSVNKVVKDEVPVNDYILKT